MDEDKTGTVGLADDVADRLHNIQQQVSDRLHAAPLWDEDGEPKDETLVDHWDDLMDALRNAIDATYAMRWHAVQSAGKESK